MAERGPVYRVGDFEIDCGRGCLRRDGVELHLRRKSSDVLVELARHGGDVVTKEQLFAVVWPDTAVTDDVLTQCIKDIRRTLDDDAQTPRYIRTVPKSGYRLIADVQVVAGSSGQASEPATETSPRRRWLLAACAALTLGAAGAWGLTNREPSKTAESSGGVPAGTIFISAFENRTQQAGWDWLRLGLADMLATGLARAEGPTVLGRHELERVLRHHGGLDRALPPEGVLAAARDARARLVVTGGFAVVGTELRIDAQTIDVSSGRVVGGDTVVIPDHARLLSDVELLTAKVAARLGAGAAARPVAEIMTTDLEAYRAYSLAVEQVAHLRYVEAIPLLEQALARDPAFAMAHAQIGYAYGIAGADVVRARPYLERAFRLSARLTERDRRLIAAWDAIVRQDYPAAIEAYRTFLAAYPFDMDVYVRLSNLLLGEGQSAEALDVAQRGLTVDARHPLLHNVLATIYLGNGQVDRALASAQRYVDLSPGEPNALDSLGIALTARGQYGDALDAFTRAIALKPSFEVPHVHAANTLVRLGRYAEAERSYRQYLARVAIDRDRARAWRYLGVLAVKRARPDEARRAAARAIELLGPSAETMLVDLAAGRFDAVRASAREVLALKPSRGMRLEARFDFYARGLVALADRKFDEAIGAFRTMQSHRAPWWHIDDFERALADTLLQAGRFDEAIAEYQRILTATPTYPLARYHLGRAYEAKGDRTRARDEYRLFLDLWRDADADVPEIIEARRRLSQALAPALPSLVSALPLLVQQFP